MKLRAKHNPDFYIRMMALILLVMALLCYFAPFVCISVTNTQDDPYSQIRAWLIAQLNGGEIKPRSASGFQMIFAFVSNKPIHENINIGPFPCNFYMLGGFLLGLAAVVFSAVPKTGRYRDLFSAIGAWLSFICLLVGRLRLKGYYIDHTKNGGEALRNLLDSNILTVTTEPMLIVSMALFLLAGMVSLLLFAQMQYDPYFVKGGIEN